MGYNVGGVDRVLRIVASLALVILATTSRSAAGAGSVWCRWPPDCLAGAQHTRCSGSKPANRRRSDVLLYTTSGQSQTPRRRGMDRSSATAEHPEGSPY